MDTSEPGVSRRTEHERAEVVLKLLVAGLEATVAVVASQRLVHARHKRSDRTTLLGTVMVRVHTNDHQVLQLISKHTAPLSKLTR